MNHASRIYHINQSLFRSSLKMAPTGVEPKLFAPFRAPLPDSRTHSQLHQLKRKLLRAALGETPDTGLFKRLSGAANQAAELAWATSHPLLVFPHLFDEMVNAVRGRFQLEQMSVPQFSHASSDADLRFEDIHSISRRSDPISTGRRFWPRCQNATRGSRTADQTARLPHIE